MELPWAHLRAAAIGLVLLGNAIYALPLPVALSKAQMREEGRQQDVTTWKTVLGAVGVQVERETIEEWILWYARSGNDLHNTLKAPFKPLFGLLGANQAWALFASATTRPERLVVEIQTEPGGPWVPVLRRLDPCCTWRDDQVRYRRIRGVWDGQKDRPRTPYKNLQRWLADRALEDFPEARRVKVGLERTWSVYPWEDPDPRVERRHERIVERGER